MGLIGHLSKCSVAFTMYIYVHYNYKANEIIFIIHGVYSKKISFKFFFWKLLHNIRWHNWANLKYEKDNQSKWNHSSLHKIKLCHDTRTPDPGAMKLIVFEEALSLITNVYFSSYAWYSGAKIFKELLLSFRIPH